MAEHHKSTENCVRVGVKLLVSSYKQTSYIPQAMGTEIGSGKVAYTCIINKNIKSYFQTLLIFKLDHTDTRLPSTILFISRASLTQAELGAKEIPLLPSPCQALQGSVCLVPHWCLMALHQEHIYYTKH